MATRFLSFFGIRGIFGEFGEVVPFYNSLYLYFVHVTLSSSIEISLMRCFVASSRLSENV